MARRSRYGSAAQQQSQKNVLIVLTVIALLLLTSGQIYHSIYNGLRNLSLTVTAPFVQLVNKPFGFFSNLQNNIKNFNLKEQQYRDLQFKMRHASYWESYARTLLSENRELRERWNLPQDFPDLPGDFTVARVIADLSGTFIDSFLINAGEENAVAINNIALDNGVLVGRIINVQKKYSRILLLTDINSRIPVIVGPNGVRAILAGNNSAMPDLFFPAIDAVIVKDMMVETSGHGGVFPPGLPIGVVASRDKDVIKVTLSANFDAMKYVDILNFDGQIIPQDSQINISDFYEEVQN